MKKVKIIVLPLTILLIGISCSKETSSEASSSNSANRLHFSFKTPDWERWVNCELDFEPIALNDSTNIVAFSSASTNASLCFSYPKDSSEMVKNRRLNRYKIKSYYDNDQPFQFSQKLPLDQNSLNDLNKKLVSNEGFSDTEYNEVTEVTYIKSESYNAVFRVKCQYQLNARIISTPEIIKPVVGTFTFLVRTSKL